MTRVLKSSMQILRFIGLRTKPIIIQYKIKIIIPVNLIRVIVSTSIFQLIIAVGVCSYQNRTTFGIFSSAIFILVGFSSVFLSYIIFIYHDKLLEETVDYLADIVWRRTGHGMNDDVNAYFDQVELSVAEMNGILPKFCFLCLVFSFIYSGLLPISFAFFGKPEPQNWVLPFHVTLPFETTNYIGFYLAWFCQAFPAALFVNIFAIILILFVGFCRYIRACADVFEKEIMKLNIARFRRPSNMFKTHSRLRSYLINLIKFHWEILTLMEKVQKLVSGPFFIELCTYTIYIAHSLHSQDVNEYTFDVLIALNALVIQTIFNFIICYFADVVTEASLNFGETLYNVDWFEFPVKEQQLIRFMIKRAQIPFYFRGNNRITCSMQTFLRLIRSATMYYVCFRMMKFVKAN